MAGFEAGRARRDLKRGDICLVSLDPSIGHEQQGTRPVLVVSPENYNRLSGMPLVVSISSGGAFARQAGLAVPLSGFGLRTSGVALCNQVRAIDIESRGGRWLESAPGELVAEVLAKLMLLLE